MQAIQSFYEGRVQGVGFRYSVKRLASGYEVIGWVRNLPDGRVELLAASFETEEIDAFLQAILDSDLGGGIRDVENSPVPVPDDLNGFSIR